MFITSATFILDVLITMRDHRVIDGIRDLSYFTACQSFLPLALAFGLKLPIAVGRIINRIHLTLLNAPNFALMFPIFSHPNILLKFSPYSKVNHISSCTLMRPHTRWRVSPTSSCSSLLSPLPLVIFNVHQIIVPSDYFFF